MSKSYQEICTTLGAIENNRWGDENTVAYAIRYWYEAGKLAPAIEQWLAEQELSELVAAVAERWDGERYLAGVKDALKAYYKENERGTRKA